MKKQRILLIAAAVISFSIPFLRGQQRFDHLVRNDFFAGFAGNREALERGMKATEAVLKESPNHAEALVWHGSGVFYLSGQAFQSGDMAKGMELQGKGLAEMKRAVELEPNNIGVRIPRGAILMTSARFMPEPMAKPLQADALSDYLTAYEIQKDQLDSMGAHPRGELLFGIADTYARLGDATKAGAFFDLVMKHDPNSVYAKRATKWIETKQLLPAREATCVGCHNPGK
jgi:tetratricopeptide (TPR) repeat protein